MIIEIQCFVECFYGSFITWCNYNSNLETQWTMRSDAKSLVVCNLPVSYCYDLSLPSFIQWFYYYDVQCFKEKFNLAGSSLLFLYSSYGFL